MATIELKQAPDKMKAMVGYCQGTGKLLRLPFVALRKPCPPPTLYMAFVSHPRFVDRARDFMPISWFHCLRKPKRLKHRPMFLMPESNFVDLAFTPTREAEPKFDYCYFTVNDRRGVAYKGLDVFFTILPTLDAMGLRGIVVVYYRGHKGWYTKTAKMVKECVSRLEIMPDELSRKKVAKIMSMCRFGLFPNLRDCSPRMIPETFLSNRPVLMNKDILGGWHYLEEHDGLGRFFDAANPASVRAAAEEVLALPRQQKDIFMAHYGFERSSRRLAECLRPNYNLPDDVTHVYFEDFSEVFPVCCHA